MQWPRYWPQTLLALLIVSLEGRLWSYEQSVGIAQGASVNWTSHRKIEARYVQVNSTVLMSQYFPQGENKKPVVSWLLQLYEVWCVIRRPELALPSQG